MPENRIRAVAEHGPLLEVTDLSVEFRARRGHGPVKAVDGVSLTVRRGEILALVGESGSGKSTTGRAILGLVKPSAGSVKLLGRELVGMPRRELRAMRKHMQLVMQDPYASLNPRMTIGRTLAEPLEVHGLPPGMTRAARVIELLETVGLPAGARDRYPHQLSGGQRQRVGIARALAANPDFIVCDEPVSSLDVSIQAQIVNLFSSLRETHRLTYLFISHDLAVVRHLADRVAVIYGGRIVEVAETQELFEAPRHQYTRLLLESIPVPSPRVQRARMARYGEIVAARGSAAAGGLESRSALPAGGADSV